MFQLKILKEDGSVYWIDHFNDVASANAWLAEEMTRPYWVSSYTTQIIDLTPPVVDDYASRLRTCHENRQKEYPPMAMFLDGMVKSDEAQIDAYVQACLAVKAKYPKPIP